MIKSPDNSDKLKENNKKLRKKALFLEHWQVIAIYLVIYDIIAVNISYFLALWLKFDCKYSQIQKDYFSSWLKFVPVYTLFCLVVFTCFKLYKSLWRYASYSELSKIVVSSVISSVFHGIAITIMYGSMPISYYIFGAFFQILLLTAVRFSYRFVNLERDRRLHTGKFHNVMLIGAGSAGKTILSDIMTMSDNHDRVRCIIDDNPNKWNRYMDNVKIVGDRYTIIKNAKKFNIEKIYIAIPSISPSDLSEILNICKETSCEIKNLPSIYSTLSEGFGVKSMKEVAVEDLLGRDPIKVNMDEIFEYIRGKVILVTGGGGSIGSELCRQVAKHNPKSLIIFDIYENNAHAIQLELKENYPELDLHVLIGSVRDSHRINQVFEKYRPEVVYHAAAHKHVPLMEYSPCEAIKNNTIGTYKTAYAAMAYGCKRFVLISTDKAVNPTNIMGASKRLCEMVIQTFDKMIKEKKASSVPSFHIRSDESIALHIPKDVQTEFVAVRFGNVLGSNGSVIPHFKEQISKGGPVTVTHPEITRFFMTIPEAVSLVLQAGVYANGGEIFVFDMGSPIKIDTLARNLIKLSGYRPDIDIKIEYTGLRAGEKLYEETLMDEEGLRKTPNKLIHIGKPISFDHDLFIKQLHLLLNAVYSERDDIIRELVEKVVPTYHSENIENINIKKKIN